ncbi:MAG: hypothetical protein ACRCZS_06610 [Chroococcidiopsis sp.]
MLTCVNVVDAGLTGSVVMDTHSLNWSSESKQRFIALMPEIWERASKPSGKKLSQDNFGKIFAVSGTTVQGWIVGSIPETPKLKKMASLLSWSLDELVLYLESGDRPGDKNEMQKLIGKLNNLPLSDLATLIEVGAKRIAKEVAGSYRV